MSPIGRLIKMLPGLAFAGLLPAAAWSAEAATPPLQVRFLLQPQIQLTEDDAPDKTSWGKDAFLRRVRVIVSGAITERISFFAETDSPNWGKNGNWSGSMFIQDAYLDVLLVKDKGPVDGLRLAAGLILLPFSHNSRQSAASLNTLDYHAAAVQFPAASHKVWRDTGLEARGLFWKKRLDVRVGVFRGIRGNAADSRPANPTDGPRLTGRVQWNVFESEDAFFLGGNYLGAKKILSLGAGLDTMAGYHAAAFDVFWDYPLRDGLGLVGQAGYSDYRPDPSGDGPAFEAPDGRAVLLEAGLRVDALEPVLSFELFDPRPQSPRPADYARNIRLGLNWWIKGHAVNLKAEYARLTTRDASAASRTRGQFTVQTQVFY